MFFALKIIRFFFGLLLKLLLLPLRILKRLLGNDQSSDYWSSTGEAGSETGAPTSETRTDTRAGLSVAATQAKDNIQWFRKGLMAVGGIQLVLGLFVVFRFAQTPLGTVRSSLVGGLFLAVIVFSITPIGIGLGLTRWPTASWYLGMAFSGLQIVLSLTALPSGLLIIAIYGGLGYLGYTGRPALVTLSSAGGSPTAADYTSDGSTELQSQPARETAEDSVPTPSQTESGGDSPSDATVSSSTEQTATPTATTAQSEAAPESSENTETTETVDSEPVAEQPEQSETDPAETDSTDAQSDAAAVGDDPVEAFRENLQAESASVRKSAVEDLLAATGRESVPDQAAIDALSARLEDNDPEVRAAACRGLGQLGAEQVKPRLKDLRIDTDPDVSRAASQALRNIE